ncbi:Cold tolerance protein 1 [Saccharomyces pastorianus]|uniref:Cold tolerance protein 1 n=1 Tax=Saccharomyces pastorianus TaxID=27292 RepID=A0A6C1E5U3_SACPS|nr:Cold tolerance protein 1 [Saccharomyces pastorianus]
MPVRNQAGAKKMRNIIISDFDETITRYDTIGIIAKLPYLINPELKPEWSHFTKTYMDGFRKYKYNGTRSLPLLSSNASLTLSHSNFDCVFKDELEFQKYNRTIELNSVNEISKQQLFKSITLEQMKQFAKEQNREICLLRGGFNQFCSSVIKNFQDDFYILSINWSREFICEIIGNKEVNPDHVLCNDLKVSTEKRPPTYTGEFDCGLLTGSDKIKSLNEILGMTETHNNGNETRCYWYIGDSETDLLSVLHPSINGVLLMDPVENPSKFLRITEQIIGVPSDKITRFQTDNALGWLKFCEKENGMFAYLVKSWDSLKDLIAQTSNSTC